jgi:ATP-dependent DNA helicase RecG
MLWAVHDLDERLVRMVLDLEEDHFRDFKDKSNVGKICKTVSALSNADGGELFVGIRDKSESSRLDNLFFDQEEANGCVASIYDMFSDGPEFLVCEFLNMNNRGLCLYLSVQKTPFVVRSADGRIYKRQNAQDREIKAQADISRLELEKGVRSFEDSATELYPSEIVNSLMIKRFLNSIVPSADPEEFLRKERLLTSNGNLRLAAVVLFDDNPQSIAPQAAAKLYRYKTLADEGDREDLDGHPETIEGTAYDVIYRAVSRTKEIVESIPIMSQAGLTSVRYPHEAIHEVICNAVLHRDYSINDYVHIRVFDNRVEVESPGKLSGPVTVKNILKQRFARNKKVVRLIAKFPSPPNKDVGEGLNTAFKSMQQLNLGRPDIEETESSVIVRLKHEPLASKEDIIKKYLIKNKKINNTMARRICNVQSDSIIRKLFHDMIRAGEIEKVSGTKGKGTKYQLVEKV